jgi:hypothetical protein
MDDAVLWSSSPASSSSSRSPSSSSGIATTVREQGDTLRAADAAEAVALAAAACW